MPKDGPAGVLLAAQKRHNMRPAHLHFLVYKPGFKTIASQVYDPQDPHLDTDSQFGVTEALIGNYVKKGEGYSLEFTFVIEPEAAREKRALTRWQAVVGLVRVVAQHEAVDASSCARWPRPCRARADRRPAGSRSAGSAAGSRRAASSRRTARSVRARC